MLRRDIIAKLAGVLGLGVAAKAIPSTVIEEPGHLYLANPCFIDLEALTRNPGPNFLPGATIVPCLGLGGLGRPALVKVKEADRETVLAAVKSRDDSERLEVQLAGCGVAALGGTLSPATPDQWGWSPAYQETLDLRRRYDALLRLTAERGPLGQEIMLYPCGCSATTNSGAIGSGTPTLPFYCGEHGDPGHENGHIIYGERTYTHVSMPANIQES